MVNVKLHCTTSCCRQTAAVHCCMVKCITGCMIVLWHWWWHVIVWLTLDRSVSELAEHCIVVGPPPEVSPSEHHSGVHGSPALVMPNPLISCYGNFNQIFQSKDYKLLWPFSYIYTLLFVLLTHRSVSVTVTRSHTSLASWCCKKIKIKQIKLHCLLV